VKFGSTFYAMPAGGSSHTCALTDAGGVACSGSNTSGQLGNGTTNTSAVPVNVVRADAGLAGMTRVSAGQSYTCATSPSEVVCWGTNTSGQLGLGNKTSPITVATPVTVYDAGVPLALAQGSAHTCALRSDGAVLCWGAGSSGQLGDGAGADSLVPVVAIASGATQIAAGANHTCARLSTGAISCWGFGVLGELGNGANVTQLKPVTVSNITNAVVVRANGEDTCALLQDATIVCWGQNVDGQLGDGTLTLGTTPQFVVGL
jgi:alpha-tubulin suppressor-like RCC1 family protein